MTGKLTAVRIKTAPPGRHFDGGGLYLDVRANGAKYWRMKFRYGGKELLLSFGVFPEVSLAEARDRRDDARKLLREGKNPAAVQRARKASARDETQNTFGALTDEWLELQRAKLAPVTYAKAQWLLGLVAPLRDRPIAEITAADVLAALRRIETKGHNETAHRAKQRVGQVFRFAIATGRALHDPTASLRGALAPVVTKSHAAVIDPTEIAGLLRALYAYDGQPVTIAALKLAPMLFVRPGNLRAMEWKELDLDAAEWRIPANKMKVREAHVVPLPQQAVAILRDLHALTGHGRYCFPSARTPDRPMSENTINAALRRMGYDGATMTGHGFRALASTRLNELGWPPDVIERQLAHAERDKVRAAYNRATHMPERRRMMQAWAHDLDALRAGAKVTPIRRGRTA